MKRVCPAIDRLSDRGCLKESGHVGEHQYLFGRSRDECPMCSMRKNMRLYCPHDYHTPKKRELQTQAPTSTEDQEARAFEVLINKVGEGKARWAQIMKLLEETEATG